MKGRILMSNKIKTLLLSLVIGIGMFAIIGQSNPAQAVCGFGNLQAEDCQTTLIFTSSNICTGAAGCITFFVNMIFLVAVLATFVVIVWGGLDYIGSAGDTAKATAARGKITNAVIGLIIVILAWAITDLALGTFSKGTLLKDILPAGGASNSGNDTEPPCVPTPTRPCPL